MTIEDRHALNCIRKDITAIEIELMPDQGQESDALLIEQAANRIRGYLDSVTDRSQGIA